MAKILYFATLVSDLGLDAEELELPSDVSHVSQLLALLRGRGDLWNERLVDDQVRVVVNKQFAEATTSVMNSDEIAIIPLRF